MPPRTAGFGNRDRFELNGKIGLHPAAGLIVLRECRQWQHNVALSGSIPLQPVPFLGKFNLWRILVAETPFLGTSVSPYAKGVNAR
jgi:hypothetical protein